MIEHEDQQLFRVRMRYTGDKDNKDYSEDAWTRNEVGIWYGAWSAEDFEVARAHPNPETILNQLPAQKVIPWPVKRKTVLMVQTFCDIKPTDWVYACFGEAIHFARIQGPLKSEENHPFHKNSELWKYRQIVEKKSFKLSQLPAFYRLIPQAGRGNVFEPRDNYSDIIRILANSRNADDVARTFERMTDKERLKFLGPSEWESFCLGFLILEKQFLPTGLSVGRTLEGLDIVGRNGRTGRHILAQCKKHNNPEDIDPNFIKIIEPYGLNADTYYFAYGGLKKPLPIHINEITGETMLSWVKSEPGKSFLANIFQV